MGVVTKQNDNSIAPTSNSHVWYYIFIQICSGLDKICGQNSKLEGPNCRPTGWLGLKF